MTTIAQISEQIADFSEPIKFGSRLRAKSYLIIFLSSKTLIASEELDIMQKVFRVNFSFGRISFDVDDLNKYISLYWMETDSKIDCNLIKIGWANGEYEVGKIKSDSKLDKYFQDTLEHVEYGKVKYTNVPEVNDNFKGPALVKKNGTMRFKLSINDIMLNNLRKFLDAGTITLTTYTNLQKNKELLLQTIRADVLNQKKKAIEFNDKIPNPWGITMNFCPHTHKQRHFWVFSPTGYGKTNFCQEILKTFRGALISPSKNTQSDVTATTQIILVDEYSPKNKFSKEDLNLLADNSYLFKKLFQNHFKIRDFIVIVLSNYTIEQVYDKPEDQILIQARFNSVDLMKKYTTKELYYADKKIYLQPNKAFSYTTEPLSYPIEEIDYKPVEETDEKIYEIYLNTMNPDIDVSEFNRVVNIRNDLGYSFEEEESDSEYLPESKSVIVPAKSGVKPIENSFSSIDAEKFSDKLNLSDQADAQVDNDSLHSIEDKNVMVSELKTYGSLSIASDVANFHIYSYKKKKRKAMPQEIDRDQMKLDSMVDQLKEREVYKPRKVSDIVSIFSKKNNEMNKQINKEINDNFEEISNLEFTTTKRTYDNELEQILNEGESKKKQKSNK